MSTESVNSLPSFCTKPTFLAHGKRGDVYRCVFEGMSAVVKVVRSASTAVHAMDMEAVYLEKANALGIGPKLFASGEGYVIMEFIDGVRIDHFIQSAHQEHIRMVLVRVFKQLLLLDTAGINKYELTNPYKHIIITSDRNPVLIDFERARHHTRPKNVTQFAEYVLRHRELLSSRGLVVDEHSFRKKIENYLRNHVLDVEHLL